MKVLNRIITTALLPLVIGCSKIESNNNPNLQIIPESYPIIIGKFTNKQKSEINETIKGIRSIYPNAVNSLELVIYQNPEEEGDGSSYPNIDIKLNEIGEAAKTGELITYGMLSGFIEPCKKDAYDIISLNPKDNFKDERNVDNTFKGLLKHELAHLLIEEHPNAGFEYLEKLNSLNRASQVEINAKYAELVRYIHGRELFEKLGYSAFYVSPYAFKSFFDYKRVENLKLESEVGERMKQMMLVISNHEDAAETLVYILENYNSTISETIKKKTEAAREFLNKIEQKNEKKI